jgi:hypothetical protein
MRLAAAQFQWSANLRSSKSNNMPRYQITAPDGRTVTVEGDSAPTEADAAEIFASLNKGAPPEDAADTGEIRAYNPTLGDKLGDAYRSVRNSGVGEALLGKSDSTPRGRVYDNLSRGRKAVNFGLRVGTPVAGAALGSIVPGPGTIAGAMLGGAGGEYAAQKRENEGVRPGAKPGLRSLTRSPVARSPRLL